jgi:hypothetical protein
MRKIRLISFIIPILILPSVSINAQPASGLKKGKKLSAKSVAAKADAKVFFITQKTTAARDSVINPPEGMVIFNTSINKAQHYIGNAWKNIPANERYIGEKFGGGIVFYLDSTKVHGLIMASADQSTSAQWGFFKEQIGANGKNIGDGKQNTDMISKTSTDKGIAANICSSLQLNGFGDWFLPSIEELKPMYYNFKAKALGNFSSTQYWSSSETDFNNAWMMNFGLGASTENNVVQYYCVRAVRHF